MHEQAKRALLAHLIALATHLTVDPPVELESGISWPQPDGRLFHLPEPWAEQFRDRARSLHHSNRWSDRFTEKFVRQGLALVIHEAHQDGEEAAGERLDSVISMFEEYAVERTVYVPITGMILSIPQLPLGQVVLKTFDEELFNSLAQMVDGFAASRSMDEEVREHHEQFKQLARTQLVGKVCAEFRTVAEADRAIERARVEARRAVELITYACVALLPPSAPQTNIVIGLDGEVPRLGPWTLSMADTGVDTSRSAPISAMPITIGEKSLIGLQSCGVMTLSELLSRQSQTLNAWEKDLLRAVHWFATSQAQVELPNRLLNLSTAVETLLTEGRGGITASVSENVALLVGLSFEDRKRVKRIVSDMYGNRSAVSHGGNKEPVESEVNEFRSIVASLIKTLLRRKSELSSKKQLYNWLEEQRLGM